MKLSTRTRYGTRALLDLALHSGDKPVLLKDIAQRQEIPLPYLERLIAPLTASGIIRSVRGPQGGIWLARPAREINFGEVVRLLEGSIAPADCVRDPDSCHRAELCATRELWNELQEAMNGILESKTLQDMVELHRQKEQPAEAMYYI